MMPDAIPGRMGLRKFIADGFAGTLRVAGIVLILLSAAYKGGMMENSTSLHWLDVTLIGVFLMFAAVFALRWGRKLLLVSD